MSSIQITGIRLSSAVRNLQSITHYQCSFEGIFEQLHEKAEVVKMVDNGNEAFVVSPSTGRRSTASVVRESGHEPYLRTHSDGLWDNNLLSLPLV